MDLVLFSSISPIKAAFFTYFLTNFFQACLEDASIAWSSHCISSVTLSYKFKRFCITTNFTGIIPSFSWINHLLGLPETDNNFLCRVTSGFSRSSKSFLIMFIQVSTFIRRLLSNRASFISLPALKKACHMAFH